MKLTLAECVRAYSGIMEIMDTEQAYDVSHALVMAKRELDPQVEFYSTQEADLVRKYAKKDEVGEIVRNGNSVQIPNEALPAFQDEHDKLDAVEVEIKDRVLKSVPEKIKPAVLDKLFLVFTFPEE